MITKPGLALLAIAFLLGCVFGLAPHPWDLLVPLLTITVLTLLGPSDEQRNLARKQRQLAIQQRKQAEQLQPPTQ